MTITWQGAGSNIWISGTDANCQWRKSDKCPTEEGQKAAGPGHYLQEGKAVQDSGSLIAILDHHRHACALVAQWRESPPIFSCLAADLKRG